MKKSAVILFVFLWQTSRLRYCITFLDIISCKYIAKYGLVINLIYTNLNKKHFSYRICHEQKKFGTAANTNCKLTELHIFVNHFIYIIMYLLIKETKADFIS